MFDVNTKLDPDFSAGGGAGPAAAVSEIQGVARSRLLTVSPSAHLMEVAALLSNAQISVVVVCNAEGQVLGTITETMLVRQLGLGQADFFETRAAAVMTPNVAVCAPTDSLVKVLSTMHLQGWIHVVMADASNKAVGVVNVRDGLRALLNAGTHEQALLRNYVMGVGYQ
ncbi:CBS domain-containing protein [Roseateles koreensis]|uniref:CBS domain-containing protein n=1 Tax=Roseateles koreensis TaxID=2987526 RepID=A0ABT5KQJ2_9BURK|nr:CBS domain-containing protein [Roseateles koreensis]MDC8785186.1 CBS domain-containing protein [Roseateles koreensis]